MKNTITQDHIKDLIERSQFEAFKAGKKSTVLFMTLPNGFEMIESSGCVDADNYDHDVGVQICKERLINRVWMLEGYRLQCEIDDLRRASLG